MNILKTFAVFIALSLSATAFFVFSGAYNIAQDESHWPLTYKVIETFRERSIAVHAQGVSTPNLDDPKLISEGAEHYAAMCTGCHLSPGMENSEIRQGLNPQPPRLGEHVDASTAEQFWIIKHGVKMTAMPAWGATHDDVSIWGLVAFLQKLPEMSQEQYEQLTTGASEHHHHHGEDHD